MVTVIPSAYWLSGTVEGIFGETRRQGPSRNISCKGPFEEHEVERTTSYFIWYGCFCNSNLPLILISRSEILFHFRFSM
jgi:hypothetical protein